MLRLADINDLEELMSIENTMFDETYYYKLSQSELSKLLCKKSTILYVWEENYKIVGYSLGVLINNKNIWFNSLAVLKEWQSTDIAKKLFRAIEEFAIESKLDTIILEIRQDNKALLRRYKGFAYCEWKNIENYYPDGCAAIRMIKKQKV